MSFGFEISEKLDPVEETAEGQGVIWKDARQETNACAKKLSHKGVFIETDDICCQENQSKHASKMKLLLKTSKN